MNALETRKKQIADGLAAADRGKHELELAAKKAGDNMRDAKAQAAEVIAQAEKRAAQIVEEAKTAAKEEGDRQLAAAQANIEQEANRHATCVNRWLRWPWRC
jgi:F-type H+-transporting ATPase subunit b